MCYVSFTRWSKKMLWCMSSTLSESCYSCAVSRWDSHALVHFTTAWSCTELQSRETLGAGTLIPTRLLSGTALQCDPLDTQLVCLSHLGFAQLLEETDLDKMTHLLLSTLEYLVRIYGF